MRQRMGQRLDPGQPYEHQQQADLPSERGGIEADAGDDGVDERLWDEPERADHREEACRGRDSNVRSSVSLHDWQG